MQDTSRSLSSHPQLSDAERIGAQLLELLEATQILVQDLRNRRIQITTMESCTGGMIADMLTSIPGSSEVFTKAAVTYANEAKVDQGVSEALISKYTVYSREVAQAMAQASVTAPTKTRTVGIGITGSLSRIDPANPENSVPGEVHIGIAFDSHNESRTIQVTGTTRYEAKLHIARQVIEYVHEFIGSRD